MTQYINEISVVCLAHSHDCMFPAVLVMAVVAVTGGLSLVFCRILDLFRRFDLSQAQTCTQMIDDDIIFSLLLQT